MGLASITCKPEAEGPIYACPAIMSSPTRLKSYILKKDSPRISGFPGSARTSWYDVLMRSSYSI